MPSWLSIGAATAVVSIVGLFMVVHGVPLDGTDDGAYARSFKVHNHIEPRKFALGEKAGDLVPDPNVAPPETEKRVAEMDWEHDMTIDSTDPSEEDNASSAHGTLQRTEHERVNWWGDFKSWLGFAKSKRGELKETQTSSKASGRNGLTAGTSEVNSSKAARKHSATHLGDNTTSNNRNSDRAAFAESRSLDADMDQEAFGSDFAKKGSAIKVAEGADEDPSKENRKRGHTRPKHGKDEEQSSTHHGKHGWGRKSDVDEDENGTRHSDAGEANEGEPPAHTRPPHTEMDNAEPPLSDEDTRRMVRAFMRLFTKLDRHLMSMAKGAGAAKQVEPDPAEHQEERGGDGEVEHREQQSTGHRKADTFDEDTEWDFGEHDDDDHLNQSPTEHSERFSTGRHSAERTQKMRNKMSKPGSSKSSGRDGHRTHGERHYSQVGHDEEDDEDVAEGTNERKHAKKTSGAGKRLLEYGRGQEPSIMHELRSRASAVLDMLTRRPPNARPSQHV